MYTSHAVQAHITRKAMGDIECDVLVFSQLLNREEKSLRHVAMVAKFLDDNKPIKSLESLFALFQT